MVLTISLFFFCHEIDKGNNEFTGSIPTEVGLLTNLLYLDLSKNKFEGSIPSDFDSLTLLEYLALGEWK